jgi:Ca2+-binding EF-hand superfamily protein
VLWCAGNKLVSKEEMAAGLQKSGIECTSEELEAIFSRFDLDDSGALSFGQFLKLLAAAEQPDF